jgi:tetratricopeptide (TPR) repeat protein
MKSKKLQRPCARSRPTDAAWSRLGDAYMQKARETMDLSYYGRAEASYRKALAMNPNYANALVGIAWVLSGRHEFEQSIEWANKALKAEPNRADAYGLLGDAATEMGDYDSAFEHYQKMLDLKPDIASYSRAAHLSVCYWRLQESHAVDVEGHRIRRRVPRE